MLSNATNDRSEYPTKSERYEAFPVHEYFVHVEDNPVVRRAWLADIAKKSGLKQDVANVFQHRHNHVSRVSAREQVMLARRFDPKEDMREASFRMRDLGYSHATVLQLYAYLTASHSLLKPGDKLVGCGEFMKADHKKSLYPVFEYGQLGRHTLDLDDCAEHDPSRLYLFVRDVLKR